MLLPPRRGGPTPPPRDPQGIHTLVRSLLDLRTTTTEQHQDRLAEDDCRSRQQQAEDDQYRPSQRHIEDDDCRPRSSQRLIEDDCHLSQRQALGDDNRLSQRQTEHDYRPPQRHALDDDYRSRPSQRQTEDDEYCPRSSQRLALGQRQALDDYRTPQRRPTEDDNQLRQRQTENDCPPQRQQAEDDNRHRQQNDNYPPSERQTLDDDAMSSDSGSSPTRYQRPDAPLLLDNRRSSYENVPPRPPSSVRRSTPSPRPRRGVSPCEDTPVRRRPASACGGRIQTTTPRGTWGHGGCCGARAVQPPPCSHHWCGGGTWGHYQGGGDSSHDCEDRLYQRIWQLELEKEQLTLQVNVLSEQVDAQSEKMFELETSLSRNQEQLQASEELLNKELSCCSSAESSRLDLMAEISDLRSRLTRTEEEKKNTQEKNRRLENELLLTAACLAEKEADLASFKSRLVNGQHTSPELEKLKIALSSVVAENEEKEKRIQELKSSLHRYKKLHELVLSNYAIKNSEGFSKIAPHTEDNFLSALDNLASCADINNVMVFDKPPPAPSSPLYSSTENVIPTPQKTPPSKRHFSTLPRPHQTDILKQYDAKSTNMANTGGSLSTQDLRRNEVRRSATKAPSGASFGRGFFRLKGGKRSSSAPQLAPDQLEDTFLEERRTPVLPPKAKGFRKIFGKVKRSGSLNSSGVVELKRGGVRATAGPRLGWPEESKFKVSSGGPFCEWDCERVCEWLVSIGLGMYAPECRRWGRGGAELLKATDFEKELCVRSPLHRKKLLLCLLGAKGAAAGGGEPEGRLDHQWVVRWLDDIGLPQYKDAFLEARVDGRMLHHLTMEDLCHLKVSNQLHTISIRTGIQVLRENHFDPFALQRRSLPTDQEEGVKVSRWSIHRVMEWLRTVDLSEYAPNLRGSGVHGGIMLYESRFDADLLATLLNIPPSKTLLRRHLATQFKQLMGPEAMRGKREAATANHVPLSPSAKLKSVRRSPFSLGRRLARNREEEYVCPMHNRTEEEKFLMKEMVLKSEEMLEQMPASNV